MTLDLSDLIGNEEVVTETVAVEEVADVVTETVAAEEVVAEEVEVVTETVAAEEVADVETETVAAEEVVAEEVVTETVAAEEVVAEEVVTETVAAEESEIKMKSVYQFLIDYTDKISNASVANVKVDSIPHGKYLHFVTKDESNSNWYTVETPTQLYLEDIIPDNIIVEKSGVIITNATRRIYVGKTNTIQFDLVDGSPVRQITFKRSKTESPTTTIVNREDVNMTVDEIKLHIKKVSSKLEATCKDLTTKEDIKTAVIAFLDSIRDLNHLIKIVGEVMMKCNL